MQDNSGDLAPNMAGLRAWIISDDKRGNQVQALGVAAALELNHELKIVAPRGLHKFLAPWGGVAPGARFGQVGAQFAPPWPDVAIGVGRASIPYIKALGRCAGAATFRIILLDPKTGPGSADVIWVPQHDRRRGDNVITTLTAPHSFNAPRIAKLRANIPADIAALPRPRIALILGGRTKAYPYSDNDHARFATTMRSIAGLGGGLMITPSRRTHEDLLRIALEATADCPRIVYDGTGPNPYAEFLCAADTLVVTADSVNMCGEAVATGRPVYVFEPSGGSAKFNRFHQALRDYGATKALPEQLHEVESWYYEPLDSSADIARQIERFWQRHKERQG